MNELINKIKSMIDLSPAAEKHLFSIASEKNISKGTILIRQGQKVTKNYFVKEGALRSFVTDKNGKEHTLQFAIKGWWMSDYIAIYNNELANLTVECLAESKVIEFNAQELHGMLDKFNEFESFQRRLLERHLVTLQRRILDQMRLSAAERYELFVKNYGEIEQQVANFHIASFLGITQESLSRIRLKNASKKIVPHFLP